LKKEKNQVSNVQGEIPSPKAPRLLGKAVKPLKAVPLHPKRSLLQKPSVKIKRRPHSHHRHTQQAPHLIGKDLLSWASQAHKYDRSATSPYFLRKLKLLFWGKRSKFGRQCSGYLEPGKASLQISLKSL
jgi:hypothetical protein